MGRGSMGLSMHRRDLSADSEPILAEGERKVRRAEPLFFLMENCYATPAMRTGPL